MVKINHLSIQLQNKGTGHPETGRAAYGVKAKKNKSEAEASLMNYKLDVT
tara:strand:- start:493 stop:642 length:150 start_codon:yes stop_codon:yes gene_type:complete